MDMKLQILVNHYKENEQIVHRFLKSLEKQTYKDYEVIIGSDGADKLPLSLFDNYSFNYQYLYLEHSGVCHTRNLLLQQSNADYVMFCDIDDEFSDENGLSIIMKKAEETNSDVIGSKYTVERFKDNEISFDEYKQDTLRVHGKIFKRQYLIDNNITFPDELEFNGDMKFVWLAYKLTQNIVWIEDNFYIWKWNKKSVTRQNPYHHYNVYDKTLKCYDSLIKDLQQRKRKDLCDEVIAVTFAMMYIDCLIGDWEVIEKETKDIVFNAINNYAKKYAKYYFGINQKLRYEAYKVMMNYYKGPAGNIDIFYNIVPWVQSILMPVNINQLYKTILTMLENDYPVCLEQEMAILKLKESMIWAKDALKK